MPGDRLVRPYRAADHLRAIGLGLASAVFPGLGQVIVGRFPRAVAVAYGAAAVTAAAVWGFLRVPTVLGVALPVALLLGVRIWAAVDAVRLMGSGPPSTAGLRRAGELAVFLVFAVALETLAGRVRHQWMGESFYLAAASMEPTLLPGDYVMTVPVHKHPVARGDVVAFIWPEDRRRRFAKRVVGVPGDTLSMAEGVLLVNGVVHEERYVSHTDPDVDPEAREFRWQQNHLVQTAEASISYHPSRNNWGPLVVPSGRYFVLGDNRDNSLDSRYWGFVPHSLLLSYPRRVYFSFDPERTRVRWSRIGRTLPANR